jgi:hypothetical protein
MSLRQLIDLHDFDYEQKECFFPGVYPIPFRFTMKNRLNRKTFTKMLIDDLMIFLGVGTGTKYVLIDCALAHYTCYMTVTDHNNLLVRFKATRLPSEQKKAPTDISLVHK